MSSLSKESVNDILNIARLKKLELAKAFGALGTKKMIAIGATAGLGLWLSSRAIGSKRYKQGDD